MVTMLQLAADFLVRISLMALFLVAFEFFDWDLAVRMIVDLAAVGMSPFCQNLAISGDIEILCNGYGVGFTKECTYIDLFLIIAPFLWRINKTLVRNLFRLLYAFIAIWIINTIRVIGSLSAYSNGIHWRISHDTPDYIIYGSILIVAVLCYWRHMGNTYPLTNKPDITNGESRKLLSGNSSI